MSRTAFEGYANTVDAYVAGRPAYPAAMLADLPNVAFAIDVGAGTGISTAFVSLRADRVLAVEPVMQMAMRIPLDRLGNVGVAVARAETIPVSNGSAGLVVCATAFHWFDGDAATAEFLRVLAQGGSLALIWNVRDRRVPWVARFDAVMDSYAGDTPRQSTGKWRRIFDDRRFEHVLSKSYPYTKTMAVGGIVDRALSTSFIAALPADEQMTVRRRIERIVEDEPSLAGQTRAAFPYVTQLYLFRKR